MPHPAPNSQPYDRIVTLPGSSPSHLQRGPITSFAATANARGRRGAGGDRMRKFMGASVLGRRSGALALIAAGLATSLVALAPAVHAADADAPVTTAPTSQAPATQSISPTATVSEVVVNGVPYKETVLPTRMSSNSVYGLDLSVMETPRNTTLLSTTQ